MSDRMKDNDYSDTSDKKEYKTSEKSEKISEKNREDNSKDVNVKEDHSDKQASNQNENKAADHNDSNEVNKNAVTAQAEKTAQLENNNGEKNTQIAQVSNNNTQQSNTGEQKQVVDNSNLVNQSKTQKTNTGTEQVKTENKQSEVISNLIGEVKEETKVKVNVNVKNNAKAGEQQLNNNASQNLGDIETGESKAIKNVVAKPMEEKIIVSDEGVENTKGEQTLTSSKGINETNGDDKVIASNKNTKQQTNNLNQNAIASTKNMNVKSEVSVNTNSGTVKTTSIHSSTNGISSEVGNILTNGKAQTTAKTAESSANSFAKTMKAQEVIDQIKVDITKNISKELDKINIQLKPKELGAIEIKMELGHDGKLQATISASNQDTLNMLQKDAAELQKALNDAGLKADNQSLNFNFRGEQNSEGQQQNSSLANNGLNGNELMEEEISATELMLATQSYNANGNYSIKV